MTSGITGETNGEGQMDLGCKVVLDSTQRNLIKKVNTEKEVT